MEHKIDTVEMQYCLKKMYELGTRYGDSIKFSELVYSINKGDNPMELDDLLLSTLQAIYQEKSLKADIINTIDNIASKSNDGIESYTLRSVIKLVNSMNEEELKSLFDNMPEE